MNDYMYLLNLDKSYYSSLPMLQIGKNPKIFILSKNKPK